MDSPKNFYRKKVALPRKVLHFRFESAAFIKQRQSRIWTREPLKSHSNPAPLSACGHPPGRPDGHRHESLHDGQWQLVMLQSEPLRMGTSDPHLSGNALVIFVLRRRLSLGLVPRPWWRLASPRAGARGRSSGVVTMLAHPEEQGSPSCKANVRSGGSTSRPKLMKFNDRLGSVCCVRQRQNRTGRHRTRTYSYSSGLSVVR